MRQRLRPFVPIGVGLLAAVLLAGLYFGIVSWAESPEHALDLFQEDRWLVIPILVGFGTQAALYAVLKLQLYMPITASDQRRIKGGGASMGAGGATSTVAMAACCAHHVTDVLPILGLTAAATFLAKYQTLFMALGLATNLIGIGVILRLILRERKASLYRLATTIQMNEDLG